MGTREEGNSPVHVRSTGGEAAKGPRIVALSAAYPGVRRVFQEAEKLGLLQYVELRDGPQTLPLADVYILGAYHSYYHEVLKALPRQSQVGMLWTSSIGEMDLAGADIGQRHIEFSALAAALNNPDIDFVWFGCRALAELFPDKGFYAPYPFVPTQYPIRNKTDTVALFAPDTLKKNHLNTISAMRLLQQALPQINLATNLLSWRSVLRELGVQFHVFSWLAEIEHQRIVGEARATLVCSWAETFCYALAESFALGTPAIFAPTIDWVDDADLTTRLAVENPNSAREIAEKLLRLLTASDYADLCVRCQRLIHHVSCEHNSEVTGVLRQHGFL